MKDHELVFEDAPFALDEEAGEGTGEIPRDLRGAALRNGPGIQRAGADRFHLLDGYGFVASARFEDGRITVRGRHVPTKVLAEERAAGRQVRRRAFTNRPGRWSNLFDTNLANVANHDVVPWGGRVWACDNPAWIPLDPVTLEPSGEEVRAKAPSQLGPMPRFDPSTERLVGYAASPGLRGDTVEIREYDASMRVVARSSHVLPRAGLALHDAVATPGHLVVQCFGTVSLAPLLWGAKPAIEAIDFDRSRSLPLLAIPRGDGGAVRALDVPAGQHGFHLFNAYEEDGKLVVDAVLYEGRVDFRPFYPPGFPGIPPMGPLAGPFPTRFVHDLRTGATEVRRVEGVRGEAPEVDARRHGKKHRFGYAATPGARGDEPTAEGYFWFHGVAKVDFEAGQHATYSFPERVYCSPPAFVPRGDAEDDGWLVVWLLDAAARRSGLAVLDARDLARGPVGVRWLRATLPAVSHASWMASPAGA